MADKERYQGKDATIYCNGSKCIHSRNYLFGRPEVFRANVRGPWIQPVNASFEDLATLAQARPPDAISYKRHDGEPAEPVDKRRRRHSHDSRR